MLEFDDIQYLVLTRVPAITGRYEFLSFRQASQGRAWLAGSSTKLLPPARSASTGPRDRWVSVAFTWAALRALGVDEASLATFPRGISARHGGSLPRSWATPAANHPDHWIGGLTARTCTPLPSCLPADPAERQRVTREHQAYLARTPALKSCLRWIWMQFHHSTPCESISGIATG